uniref:(northern house mosquito) hypothetical protein n=1 Tax=Culex pipiens TaxID=7175 RepID=A0A8D8BGJ1_CULPI
MFLLKCWWRYFLTRSGLEVVPPEPDPYPEPRLDALPFLVGVVGGVTFGLTLGSRVGGGAGREDGPSDRLPLPVGTREGVVVSRALLAMLTELSVSLQLPLVGPLVMGGSVPGSSLPSLAHRASTSGFSSMSVLGSLLLLLCTLAGISDSVSLSSAFGIVSCIPSTFFFCYPFFSLSPLIPREILHFYCIFGAFEKWRKNLALFFTFRTTSSSRSDRVPWRNFTLTHFHIAIK